MSAVIVDGRAAAAELREELATQVAEMKALGLAPPSLAVVLCGDDPASAIYVRNKGRAAERAGIRFQLHTPPRESTTDGLVQLVRSLDADDAVDGILGQSPALPDRSRRGDGAHLPGEGRRRIPPVQLRAPRRRPSRRRGTRYATRMDGNSSACYDAPLQGSRAVVIGRSAIVGRPVALMLTNADFTVTICHSRTPDLASVCREADILVSAIGRPRMIDASYVKPGAFVIDVGTTPKDGVVIGDIDRESVEPVAGWLTPVPGGVGPMTIAMLLRNTLALARVRRRRAEG